MRLLIFLQIIIVNYNLQAQNYIRNYSFDEKFNCPNYQNYRLEQSLYNWKGNGKSIYFNKCNVNQNEPYWLTNKIPSNGMGYQEAINDSGYCGIFAITNFSDEARGVIFQKMKYNLSVGQMYWIEFKSSLADSSFFAIKNLGVSFQNDTTFNTVIDSYARPFKLINSLDFIDSKTRWTNLNWIYEADSTYSSIVIGYANNISTLIEVDTVFVDSICHWCNLWGFVYNSFYYIENVGVYPIISNNQTLQPCTFPQVMQGPVGNDIWFREWKKDTTVLSANINQTINQAGTYTLTWRKYTTVHIDTFWVEASVPISDFLGQDIAWQSGNSITLTAPNGFSYLWNTGSNSQDIMVDTTGIFSVVFTNTFDCAYTDSVEVFNPLGLEEVFEKTELQVYPNPALSYILVSAENDEKLIEYSRFEIISLDGRINTTSIIPNTRLIDISKLNNGIYFVKVINKQNNGFLISNS